MTNQLSSEQLKIHNDAIKIAEQYRRFETQMIVALLNVERSKLLRQLDCSSLFKYAVDFLKIDEKPAYPMITLARKCLEVPRLQKSIIEQKLSVARASRIVSTVTCENAEHLVGFAEMHTTLEINREVGRLRKKAGLKEILRNLQISDETLLKLKRARSLIKEAGDLDDVLSVVLDDYIECHDPVKKAERAERRKNTGPIEKNGGHGIEHVRQRGGKSRSGADGSVRTDHKREKPRAAEMHAVNLRDQRRCTHKNALGVRCANDRYLEIHHIHPVSQGGTNDPENLTTLCGFHHDEAHQLSFPFEGLEALRSPSVDGVFVSLTS